MTQLIVHSLKPVLLVGGADLGPDDLNIFQSEVPTIVAVDGGADHLIAAGITPDAVVGDMDSISQAARELFKNKVLHVTEQDTVDFEKALSVVHAPLIYAVGFSAGRLDHALAVINVLARFAHQPIILVSETDVAAIVPPSGLSIVLEKETRISLMPIVTGAVTVTGVVWPLTEQVLSPLGMSSPSNKAIGGAVTIRAERPVLLVLPTSQRERLAAALMQN